MSAEEQSPDRAMLASPSGSISSAPMSPPAAEEMENEHTHETKRLLAHVDKRPDDTYIFLEKAPFANATLGAKCRLSTCPNHIETGSYRICLLPGMINYNGDFYHPRCFEKIADLTKPKLIEYLAALTRETYHNRKLKSSQLLDGTVFLDGGAERLFWEWIERRERFFAERGELQIKEVNPKETEHRKRGGSASYEPPGAVEGMEQAEYDLHLGQLAAYESDGPGDMEEWNLFECYLDSPDPEAAMSDRHNFSKILKAWARDVKLANIDDEIISDRSKQLKATLTPKHLRALQRLSLVPPF